LIDEEDMSITLGILNTFVMIVDGSMCLLMLGFVIYGTFFIKAD